MTELPEPMPDDGWGELEELPDLSGVEEISPPRLTVEEISEEELAKDLEVPDGHGN